MAATHFSGPVISTAGFQGTTGFQNGTGAVESVTAAKTFDSGDNGKSFVLNAAAGATLTLPAPIAGYKIKFIVGTLFATTDWVVTATGAIMQGSVMEAGAIQAVASATTINLELAADTIGDWVKLESDGTSWFVDGGFVQALSVTPA